MIFQDPMTSLNPVLTIGRQIREALEAHFDLRQADGDARAVELLDQVGIPSPKHPPQATIRTSSRAACGSAR